MENLGCNFSFLFSNTSSPLLSLSANYPFPFPPLPSFSKGISDHFPRPFRSPIDKRFLPPSFPHPFNGHTWLEEKGRGNHFATKIFRLFSGGGHEGRRASPFSPFFLCICLFSAVQTLRQKPCRGKMLPHKILFSFGQTTASTAQSSSDQMSNSF